MVARTGIRAGQSKDDAKIRYRADPRDWQFIGLNTRSHHIFFVVDLDHVDGLERSFDPRVPEPTYIYYNPLNGHAQYGWMLDDPVHRDADRAMSWVEGIDNALRNLLGGDWNFTGLYMRNPFAAAPAGDVFWSDRGRGYRLAELKQHLVEHGAWDPRAPQGMGTREADGDYADQGRNNNLFVRLLKWARGIMRKLGRPATREELQRQAAQMNDYPVPMGESEVAGIGRSGHKQQTKGPSRGAGASEHARRMGRKGGLVKSDAKTAAARQNSQKAAQALKNRTATQVAQAAEIVRHTPTWQALAEEFGWARSTARDYLERALEYLAEIEPAGYVPTSEPGVSCPSDRPARYCVRMEQEPPAPSLHYLALQQELSALLHLRGWVYRIAPDGTVGYMWGPSLSTVPPGRRGEFAPTMIVLDRSGKIIIERAHKHDNVKHVAVYEDTEGLETVVATVEQHRAPAY